MKKYTYLLIAGGLVFSASSCKKSYTCECTSMDTQQKTYYEFKGKKKATSKCAELGKYEAVDGPHCELK
jgi:hypothetical protein